MIQVDRTDFLYKTLQKLGEDDVDTKYLEFAQNGICTLKDFNNYIQSQLGMDYIGEFDENLFEEVVDYYKDIKISKVPSKNRLSGLLKQYQQNPTDKLKMDIINSQLKEVLLIACAYKLCHNDVNLNDLVQVCNLGLIKAVNMYDEQHKLAFDTYLNYWILQTIQNEFTQGEKNG